MSPGEAPSTVVVPCGGFGTRLAPSLGTLPKVLAPVAGRPLLAHLLSSLRREGVRRAYLLAGVGADEVQEAVTRLAPADLDVRVLVEPAPLGTAGVLALARDELPERFGVAFGDLFIDLDWSRFWHFAVERGGMGTLVLHRSSHPEDSDAVVLDDSLQVVDWQRRGEHRGSGARLTNAAVGIFHRSILERIPRDRASDLTQELLPALVEARAPIFGYTTSEYLCDLGTPTRLEAVDGAVSAGRAELKAELVLLDRDGVLTEDATVTRPEDLKLLPGAAESVRELRASGVRVCVVTNQAVVARGLCSAAMLEHIHERLRELLRQEGAELDGLYCCPHHPETHHGEGVDALRGPCPCRKPSTGLVERALSEQGVSPWRALVVGDSSIDAQLAHNARLACALVGAGDRAPRPSFPAAPQWRFADLREVAAWILGRAQE